MAIQTVLAAVLALLLVPSSAFAQRIAFERSFDVAAGATLDASTLGGRISVRTGEPGRLIVRGTATVRVAWDVPANAVDLARQIAAAPPIEREGDVFRLRPPSDEAQRRAAVVAYEVIVPPATRVSLQSVSGDIVADGLSGPAVLQTQSGKIGLTGSSADTSIRSGSGAVTVDRVAGRLTVTTTSSAIVIRDASGAVHVRTQSGAVAASLDGAPTVDIETGSSGITVAGAAGGVTAVTQSGAIELAGVPGADWNLRSGSGRIAMTVGTSSQARFDLSSRSGAITVPDTLHGGTVTRRHVAGAMGGGAHRVTAESGSGAIVVRASR